MRGWVCPKQKCQNAWKITLRTPSLPPSQRVAQRSQHQASSHDEGDSTAEETGAITLCVWLFFLLLPLLPSSQSYFTSFLLLPLISTSLSPVPPPFQRQLSLPPSFPDEAVQTIPRQWTTPERSLSGGNPTWTCSESIHHRTKCHNNRVGPFGRDVNLTTEQCDILG